MVILSYQGKSLIEVSITMTIIMIIATSYWFNSFCDNKLKNKNLLKLKQLQQGLYFARSEAVRLKTKVHICPSYDLKECCYSWTEKIIIFTVQKDSSHKRNFILLTYLEPIFYDQKLRFRFFGNQQEQKITFLPSGKTINNGHFCTDYHNMYDFACLYINQAGRSYVKINHNL